MPDGISDIISEARQFSGREDGNHVFAICVEELQAACSPARLNELLRGDIWRTREQRRRNHRGLSLLRRAASAAKKGKAERCTKLYEQAREIVGDNNEFLVLLESNRGLVLTVTPEAPPPRRPKLSFADCSI